MGFAGEVPWHGLGVKLPRNATWADIKAALPFYTVKERRVYAEGIATPLPDRKALVAGDDGRYLATVGIDYGVVQFDDLAEAVMRAIGSEAVFHTAGLLGPLGARGWVLGEIPEPIRVKNDPSEIRRFFLATTAHDGFTPVDLVNAATRVVCANTLGAALGERSGFHVKIRHTSRAALRVQDAADSFKGMLKGMERFGQLANALAETTLSDDQRLAALDLMLPPPADDASDRAKAENSDRQVRIAHLAEQGRGIGPAMRGTAWALFQGATEWADHERKIQGAKAPSVADRFNSQFFGPAAEFKRDALAAIVNVANLSPSWAGGRL
jgi:phage/plasmid-like protein (TIGR03299 family)